MRELEELGQDIGYAWRKLRRDRGFTLVVVSTLALGIAANTLIFSVINPYFFRQLPFGEPERLLQIEQVDPINNWDHARLSLPQYLDWKERSRAFKDMAAYYYNTVNVTGGEGPERVGIGYLTANMFAVLDAAPLLGRTFVPGEDGPGGEDVVVLSHGLWKRRYGGDPGIVGKTIYIDGTAHTVIGVMPGDFNFPFGGIKMWRPIPVDLAQQPRERNGALVIGRLAPGWTPERARAELAAIQRELSARYPEADGAFTGVTLRPLREALNFAYDILRVGFGVLLAAVFAVLLVACVNVASLTLARSSGRAREVAVRAAVGASRGRLVRQFLTESTLLAFLGGALGVLLTHWSARSIGPAIPEDLYRIGEISVDGRVLLFSVALTLATPLFFGLAPALAVARTDLSEALKEGSRGASSGRTSLRGRRALVVTEVALAVVLISGAGLMLRSFLEVQQVDLGFEPERILTVEVRPPPSKYDDREAIAEYFDRATARLAALPGVQAASTVDPLPLNHETATIQFARPDATPARAEDWPVALYLTASPGFFEAMGIPVLAGKTFERGLTPESPVQAVVSRKLADRYWPGESPVGRTVLLGGAPEPTRATVVGVVGDIKHSDVASDNRPQLWLPLAQSSARRRFLVMRMAGPPASAISGVREAMWGIDPDLPVTIRPMEDIVFEHTYRWGVPSIALACFGGVALLLAALGIYGVISYSVASRRREMGIRVALGASLGQIRRLVVGEGLRLSGLGVAIGLLLALAVGRVLASMLFGIGPFDPLSLGTVILLFLAVAAAASLVPAMKAARSNPQEVLRAE